MKKRYIYTLAVLLCQTASVLSMESHNESYDDKSHQSGSLRNKKSDISADELRRRVDEISSKVPDSHPDHKLKRVIVIGPTGSGKTTLIHGLAGQELKPEKGAQGMGLKTQTLDGFNISSGVTVGTTIPHSWHDPLGDVYYWDCPGFGDPRGPAIDIVNAYAVRKLFRNTHAKILLTVPEPYLYAVDRGTPFLKLLEGISDLFPNQAQIEKAISIVVTKHRDADIDWALDELVNNQEYLEAGSRPHKLLTFLHQNRKTRVTSFPYPAGHGTYHSNKQGILDCLQAAFYVESPTFNIRVGDSSKLFLDTLAGGINQFIVETIAGTFVPSITDKSQNEIETHHGNITALRTKFSTLGDKLDHITREQDPEKIFEELKAFNDVTLLRKSKDAIEFLREIRPQINYQIAEWVRPLSSPKQQIYNLTKVPEQTPLKDGVIFLKSSLIGTSDIGKVIRESRDPVSKINVFCSNTFLVDENITRSRLSLNILSPQWIVIDTRTINLSGTDGNNGSSGTDGTGADGCPGEPGIPGKHFFGKGASKFEGFQNFTVISNGGNGGNGGKGGSGTNGANGQDGNLSVSNNVAYHRSQMGKEGNAADPLISRWIPESIRQHEITLNGTQLTYGDQGIGGTPGGNGGRGAEGGKAGLKGGIFFEGSHLNSKAGDGKSGNNENPGEGGRGGIHGKPCQGTLLTGVRATYTTYDGHGGFVETGDAIVNHHDDGINDIWTVSHGHVDRGRANPGAGGGNTLVASLAQTPNPYDVNERAQIIEQYKDFYNQQETMFRIDFPNLK